MPQMLLSALSSRMEGLAQNSKQAQPGLSTEAKMRQASPILRVYGCTEGRYDKNKWRNYALDQYG